MSEELQTSQAVKFPRYERRGFFMGFKWYQLLLTGAGVLVACVASAVGGPRALFALGPLWLGLMLVGVLQYSRIPAPVWIANAVVFFIRAVTKQTKYLASPEHWVRPGQLVLPGGLGTLELRTTVEGACFLVDRHGKEAMAAMRCSTGSFALLDAEDKAYAVQAWSRVQAGLAQRTSIARIAVQDYTVPYPSRALRDFYDMQIAQRSPESAGTPWGDRSYLDLITAAGSAMSHEVLVTVVVDMAKARRRVKDAGGGVTGLEYVVRSEVEALQTGLKTHDVIVEEWLTGSSLMRVMRSAFDPAAVVELSTSRVDMPLDSYAGAGPVAVEEHWSYLRTDSGFHQTFWVSEWPRQKVFPGFIHPLIYVGDFRHTVTQVIRAVPTAEALRDIRSAQEAHETRRRINSRFDRPLTREQRAEEEEVAQREEEIVAGHGDIRPAAYVTISADSLENLARHRQELESAAAGAFVELRLLAGQQWAAFVAGALPLGRGLR